MIIKYYSSESAKPFNTDEKILKSLVEKYGAANLMNNIHKLNEAYYGSGLDNMNYTGGSEAKGLRGAIKSIPSMLTMGLLSWPLLLISGLGILRLRQQQHWRDKTSRLNQLDPRWWTEYFGTRRSSAERKHDNKKNPKDSSSYTNDSSSNTYSASAPTEYQIDNAAFKTYWVYLSNGEIIRLRGTDENDVKEQAKFIVEKNESVYSAMNKDIANGYCGLYMIYFNDGEISLWAAENSEIAKERALNSRKDLTDALNTKPGEDVQLKKLEYPEIVKVKQIKKSRMEYPKKDYFRVTTKMPDNSIPRRSALPALVYEYETLRHYKVSVSPFSLNIAGISSSAVSGIVKSFYKSDDVRKNIMSANQNTPVFKVKTLDNDTYYISAESSVDAKEIARKYWNIKTELVRKALFADNEASAFFEQLLDEQENKLSETVSCTLIYDYKLKPTKTATIKLMANKSEVESTWKIDV